MGLSRRAIRCNMGPVKDLLSQVWLFEGLGAPALDELAELAVARDYGEEDYVYRHGESSPGMFIVESGEVVLIKDAVGKPVQLLKRAGPGEFFGENGLLEGRELDESARTAEASRLLMLPRDPFLAFLANRPLTRLQLRRATIDRASANIEAALSLSTRKEVRIRVNRDVRISLADGSSIECVLENLSLGGAALRGLPETWVPGRPVGFFLGLPEAPQLLRIQGTVAWRKNDKVGIAFRDDAPEMKVRISSALQELLPRRTP